MYEIGALCLIILLYTLRLLYKAKKDHEQLFHIDKDWKPTANVRRSTSEYEGKS